MNELGFLKKKLSALSAAINEYEKSLNSRNERVAIDLKQELGKLNVDELKEIGHYVTELMLNKVSGKKPERTGRRMPLAVKQNMVNKYLAESDVKQEVREEYLAIEQKRPKDRDAEERKKFMDVRNKAQKWYENNYSDR